MKQFLTYSLFVHFSILLILYNINVFDQPALDPLLTSEKEKTQNEQSIEDEFINDLIMSQAREKKRRINEVKEILEETVEDLSPKQLKTFSDLITSSDLDKEKIDELTEEYLYKENPDQVNELKDKLLDYIESPDSGLADTAKRFSTGMFSQKDSSSNTGPQDVTGEESTSLDVNYQGSKIIHDMPQHEVVSEADQNSRCLTDTGFRGHFPDASPESGHVTPRIS